MPAPPSANPQHGRLKKKCSIGSTSKGRRFIDLIQLLVINMRGRCQAILAPLPWPQTRRVPWLRCVTASFGLNSLPAHYRPWRLRRLTQFGFVSMKAHATSAADSGSALCSILWLRRRRLVNHHCTASPWQTVCGLNRTRRNCTTGWHGVRTAVCFICHTAISERCLHLRSTCRTLDLEREPFLRTSRNRLDCRMGRRSMTKALTGAPCTAVGACADTPQRGL